MRRTIRQCLRNGIQIIVFVFAAAMKYVLFTVFLAVLKESHPLNPKILKYDQFMKDFEETGHALKQEDVKKKMAVPIQKRRIDEPLSPTDEYYPYETYGEAIMECVYLMSSQREHVLEAEKEVINHYGISEDHEARKLVELFRSTEILINQTFKALCVRLQGELKPNERYAPINDITFAKLSRTWNEVRRYLEQREEQVDDSGLLLRISQKAEQDMSKTYNFMKGQIKKLRDNGW